MKRAPVQADNHASLYQGHPARVQEEKRLGRELRPAGTITWEEHLEAWRGCNARFPGQSAERIAFLGREPHTWEAR